MRPQAVPRPDLAAGLTMYTGSQGPNFMGWDIAPIRRVSRKSDTFPKALFSDKALVIGDPARAAKSGYERLNYRTTTDTYACQDEGLEDLVDDVQQADVQEYFNAEQDCANGVLVNLMRKDEINYADLLFNATTLASYTGGVSTEWDTAASATPFADVNDAVRTMLGNIGAVLPAECSIELAVSAKVFANLANTTDIKGRRGGGSGARRKLDDLPPMTQDEMAMILGIDAVHRGRAKNGSADIWDDEYALVFVNYRGTQMSVPHYARTFLWREDADSDYVVETYRGESNRSTVVRVRHNVDREIVNVECAYLLSNITT